MTRVAMEVGDTQVPGRGHSETTRTFRWVNRNEDRPRLSERLADENPLLDTHFTTVIVSQQVTV